MENSAIKQLSNKLFKRELKVREATTEDLSKLTMLLGELFRIESDFVPNVRKQRQGLASLMDNDAAMVLVATMRGSIIGMCSLQPLVSTAEGGTVGIVEDLVVTAAYRDRGVGAVLLTKIEAVAVKHHMSRLQLLLDKSNKEAAYFYDRCQWSQTQMTVRRKVL